MKTVKHCLIIIAFFAIICFSSHSTFSQTALNEISFLTKNTGFGARAMGMGGAYSSVGGDYSSVHWNPAGIGFVKRKELFVSFLQLNAKNTAAFYGTNNEASKNFTKLDALGYVFPVPTYRGNLAFAIGYNRIHNYSDIIGLQGRNPNMAYSFYVFEDLNVGDNLFIRENLDESGQLGQYSFSGSVEAYENFFVGATLNLLRGKNEYVLNFREIDDRDYYTETDDTGFEEYYINQLIKSEINAVELKIGGLYKVNPNVFVGGTITLPKTYKIKETYNMKDYLYFDDGYVEPYDELGYTRYRVSYPFSFSFGGSVSLSSILLSGDIEYTDLSQMKYDTDPPVDYIDREEANLNIRTEVGSVLTKRIGAEVLIPNTTIKVRAGYFTTPSPYKLDSDNKARKGITGGLGVLINEDTIFDISIVRTSKDKLTYDDFIGSDINEETKKNYIFATLSVRF